jgi:hypothetical protein
LQQLLGSFAEHVYMIHVGAGWAWARLRVDPTPRMRPLDPLLRWLAIDGYGFHEGYFHWRRYAAGAPCLRLNGYQHRGFDQGLGRSLWFVFGGDVERIAGAIAALAAERHDDLWSGVGLAATYAGGVDATELAQLKQRSAAHLPSLAQGAAFAAKARLRAGVVPIHVETACRILTEHSAGQAASWTDAALTALGNDGELPAFATWRDRISTLFSEATNGATVPASTSA